MGLLEIIITIHQPSLPPLLLVGTYFTAEHQLPFSRVRRKDSRRAFKVMKDQNEFGCKEKLAKWLMCVKVTELEGKTQGIKD